MARILRFRRSLPIICWSTSRGFAHLASRSPGFDFLEILLSLGNFIETNFCDISYSDKKGVCRRNNRRPAKKDAVELVPEEDAFDVPQWQKDEVRKRIDKYKNHPELLIDEDTFLAMLNED